MGRVRAASHQTCLHLLRDQTGRGGSGHAAGCSCGGGGGGAVGAGGAGGGAAFPWASTTLGVFLCIECAGVHRGLGAAVSAVRSVALDAWGPAEAAAMERRGGNALANACWEYHVPSDWPKPSAKEDREYRADYIKAKYVAQLFAQRPRRPARPRPRPRPGDEGGAALSSSGPGPGPGPAGALRNGSGDGAGMVMFIGILNITLIKGQKLTSSAQHHKHLPKRNHNIYCTFRLGKQEIRSKKVKGKSSAGCNPEWDENLMLCWDGHSKFEINVYSDVASLGSATTDLRQLLLSSSSPIDASATSVPTPGSIDSSGGGRNLSQELWEASLGQNHHSDSLRNGTGGRSLFSMEEQSRTGHGGGNPLDPNFIPDQADSGEVWVLLDGDESYVRKRSSSDSPIVMGRKDIPSFFNQPRQNDSLTTNTYNNNNKVVLDEQDPIAITNELSRKDSASAPATPSEKTSRKKRTFLPKSTGKKKTTSTQLHNGHVEATERAQEEEVVRREARSLSPPPSSNILSNSSSPSTSVVSKKKRSFLPRSAIKKERSGAANHNNLAVSNQDSSIPLEQKGSIQIRLSFSKLDS